MNPASSGIDPKSEVHSSGRELWHRESIAKAIAPCVPMSWITARDLPRTEFEADYQKSKEWITSKRDEFEELHRIVSEGDEVATFSSPPATWQYFGGRAGWAVIRNGVIIGQVVTVTS